VSESKPRTGGAIRCDTIGGAAGCDRDELRAELVQVAAVAVAWIESLDYDAVAAGNGP
jgi:hypothetical protein